MLSVIGSILRVLGIILLVLLGILLVILLLVLFMPIIYRAEGEKQNKLLASAKVRWLFGLLRAEFIYPEPGSLVVKVLFFKVFDSGAESSQNKKNDSESAHGGTDDIKSRDIDNSAEAENAAAAGTEADTGKSEASDTPEVMAISGDPAKKENTFVSPQNDDDWINQEAVRAHEAAWQEVERKLRGEKAESKFDKFKYTFHNTCDKIKEAWKNITYYKNILSENETRLLLDHVMLRIGKILKSIRPRKLSADLLFGTGSPDTTGYILGVYGMLSPFIGGNVILTPDFEAKILKGSFGVAGHITIARILWQGLLLVLDRNLWHFIDRIKHKDDPPRKQRRKRSRKPKKNTPGSNRASRTSG